MTTTATARPPLQRQTSRHNAGQLRVRRRVRLRLWLRASVLACTTVAGLGATAAPVRAQDGSSSPEVIPAGSLIIPMDNDKQNIGAAFNIAGYGLAVAMLNGNIPVKWSISDVKAKDGDDFAATAARVAPGALPAAVLGFAGGPFIIHAAYADTALKVIASFGRNVAVYELTQDATVPIRHNLLFKPRPFVNVKNASIITNVLDRAGITRYTVGPDFSVENSSCYSIIVEPHNDDVTGLPVIQSFLETGGNFFAQCESVNSFENAAAASPLKFLTTGGIVVNNNGAPFTYPHPTAPFSQVVGPVDGGGSGSVRDWSLRAGSAFMPATQNHLQTSPTIWAGAVADVFAGPGGNIFYLGGHDYGTSTTNISEINGLRMLLNAIMSPATRPGVCNLEPLIVPIPDLALAKTGPAGFTGPEATYSLTVSNLGTATAPDALVVTDTLPEGLVFSSAAGAGWTFSVDPTNRIITALNPVRLAVGATASFTITVTATPAAAGVAVTNRAWVAEQGESNTANNVATAVTQVPGITGLVFEDANQNGVRDPDEVGLPGIRVDVTSGATTVTGVTDAEGWWTVVGVPPGAAIVDVRDEDLPAGAFHTSAGEDPSPVTAPTAGLADAGIDGYAGLLTSLAVTKTGPATALVSDTVRYVITTTNAGPATARLLVVTDTLGAGMTFLGSSRGATESGGVVTFPPASLAVGGTLVDTVVVRMPDEAGTVLNIAAAMGAREDPDLSDNRSATSTLLVQPDLAITKVHTGDFTVGAEGEYVITVANNGDGAALPATVVTDTLPAGLTFVSAAGIVGGWTFVNDGQVVTATLPTPLAAGASASFRLRVLPGAEAVPFVRNVATVAGQREAATADNSAADSARVRSPDLTASKSAGSFTQGVPGVYTITVYNVGDGATTGAIAVRDSLREGLTFVSGAAVAGGWTITAAGQVVTATHAASLAAGDSAKFTLTVLPGPAAVPAVENVAVVSGGSQFNLANDTTPLLVTPVTGIPDLAIAKSAAAPFTYGATGSYSISVSNVGAAATTAPVTVTDTLPAGLRLLTATGAEWSFAVDSSGPRTIVTATRAASPPMAPAAVASFMLDVRVLSTAASVVNTAWVAGGGETNTENNSATVTTPVDARPDLAIVKTGPAGFVVGLDGVYTITVTNVGSAPTTGTISVVDTLPDAMPYRSRNNGTFGNTGRSGQVVTGTHTTALAPGASIFFTITVRPLAGAVPEVTNTAYVSGGGDANPDNNISSLTTPVTAVGSPPDVTVTKTSSAFSAGQPNATYTVTVRNIGGSTTSGVTTVVDTLPEGVAWVSGAGTGWTVGAVEAAGRWVVTATSSQAVAANANFNPLTLTVAIAADAPASVTNTAFVSGGGETNADNNEGSVTTAVQRGDLTVTKTAGTFTYGSNASYSIIVANAGPGGSYGAVTVVDTLPNGLAYVSAVGTGWTASAVQSAGRWIVTATTSQALAAAGNYNTLTITATVTSATAAPVTNRVHVSGGNETNTTNNSGSVTTTSIVGPDLAITKTTSLALFTPGQAANYTITVSSVGTSNVSGSSGTPIVVLDTLPVGLTLATAPAVPTGWNTLTSTLDAVTGRYIVRATRTSNLNVGVSISFTINPLVTTAAIPTAYNRAYVSAGVQHNTLNDTASVTTPVAAPDLVIVKTATGTFYVGGTASYRIVVRNAGTAPTAGDITVTDPLPAGLTWIAGASSGAGWTLTASGQTVTATYTGAALAPNDSTVIVLGVSVSADAVPAVTNTATVAGGGDANTANNSSSVTTPVGAQPDLTVSKSAGTLTYGSIGSYVIRVRNIGTLQTTGTITVTDTLPAGLTFVPGSGTGAGWTIDSGDGVVVVATSATAIAAGDSADLAFQVSVGAAAVPSVSNKVYVAGGGQFNTTNDTARVSTPVLAPDLVIAKTADPLQAGQTGTFTITVTNVGTAVTTALITVTDVLPGTLTFVGAAGAGWSADASGQTVTATFAGPLAPGASASFTLTTMVSAPAGTSVTNTAEVEGGGEVDDGNNSASVTVAVSGQPALLLLKSASPAGSVFPGAELTYTISFQNSGNADAIDVQVTDALPEQVQFKLESAASVLPPGIGAQLEYFDGTAWSDSPPPATCGAPAGFSGCVSALRLRLLQPLPAAEQGSWSFVVRVK